MGNQSNDIDLLIDGDINAGIDFAIWFCDKMKLHAPLCYGLYGTAMFNLWEKKSNVLHQEVKNIKMIQETQ